METQKYLKINGLDKLIDEFSLLAKVYDDRVVLNYKVDSKPKFHPIVKECRGLILSLPDYKVLCRSFDRFFNYGEGDDKDVFDWNNSIIFDKLDGSCINVYHDGIKWSVATRGTAFAEGTTPTGKSFYDLFIEAIGNRSIGDFLNDQSTDYTYIFELTSPENRVVTRYSETKVTLLAIRNRITGKYVDYSSIEGFPFASLVESYNFKSPDDIIKFVESRDAMVEGCVCYDINSQLRIKVKNSSYVAIHHMKGNDTLTTKSIVTLLLKGEVDEYLVYFPEDIAYIKPFIDIFEKLKSDVVESFDMYKNIDDQKTFALAIQHLSYKSFLFSIRKGVKFDDLFSIDNINVFLKLLSK